MKIQFMLNGGGMPPFTYYLPVAINTLQPQQVASQTSSTSDATEKGKLTDKDMLEMLGKIDGLPNDMNLVYNMMSNFFREKELGISVSSLSTTYLRALQSLKEAKFNKEQFDAAFKHALKNGSLSEIAITDSGQVVVTDGTTKFKFISPEEYLKDKDKYKYYTNLDLLLMRLQDPTLAYQNNVFNVVNTAISSLKLGEMIDGFMYNLGSIEHSVEGFSKVLERRVVEGIDYLQNAANQAYALGMTEGMTIDGLYKSKILNKTQALAALRALRYIYLALPENAKTLIKLKSDGTDKGIQNYLADYVLGQTDEKMHFDLDMLEDEKGLKPGSRTKDAAEGSGKPMNTAETLALGRGDKQLVEVNMGNSYSFKSIGYSGVIGPGGHSSGVLPADASLADVQSSNIAGNLNMHSATFGGSLLNDNGLRYSTLKDASVVVLELPIDYNAPNGIIRPDLGLGKNLEKAEDEIRKLGISETDHDKINEIYQKYGLQPKYLPNNTLNTRAYHRFAMVYANVDGRILDEETFNPEWVDVVDDDNSRDWFEQTIKLKTNEKNYSMGSGFLGLGGDTLYRGAVFIPFNDNLFSATMAGGLDALFNLPTKSADEVYQRLELLNILNQTALRYNKAPSLSTLE